MLHFRMRVPIPLQRVLGRSVVKRSLGTRDMRGAQLAAYTLAGRYMALFEQARRQLQMNLVPTPPRLLPEDDPDSPFYMPPYRVEKTRDGYALETDGSDSDHEKGLEALRTMMAAPLPVTSTVADEAPGRLEKPHNGIALGEAAQKYLLTLDSATLPDKTRSQKKAAVLGFAKWKGLKSALAASTRTDVSEWVQTLRATQLATPTLYNKCSYLRAFFKWAQGAGHYPQGDNPAAGQVTYGTREKRLRRKLGFEPLSVDQLRIIYSPESLAKLKDPVRWGAWLGLYSGARVSEIGQLRLEDFFEEEGVPCFRITASGVGQSLKTDASERIVPLHPELVRLGLLDYVDALRKSGKDRLFPRAKVGSVNGAGNFLSAAFGRHLTALGVKAKVGKVGFHSLRKTVIQTLQTAGVPSEVRAQLVGHLLDDEHHATYSRRYTIAELAAWVFPSLVYWE
jgi:integrase